MQSDGVNGMKRVMLLICIDLMERGKRGAGKKNFYRIHSSKNQFVTR